MEHHDLSVTATAGGGWLEIGVRLALLLLSCVVAGAGLLRPTLPLVPRGLVLGVSAAGAGSAVLAVVSVLVSDVNPVGGGLHAMLALAVGVLLRRPAAARWPAGGLLVLVVLESAAGRSGVEFALDTGFVAVATVWFGIAALATAARSQRWRPSVVRLGPLAGSLAVLLTAFGLVQLGLSGVGFDRRLFVTGYGLTLLAVVVLPVVTTVLVMPLARADRHDAGFAFRAGAGFVALAFVAWTALVAVPKPADLPVPGVPLLAAASLDDVDVPVLVSPQRPGPNLVHLPDSAGSNVTVSVRNSAGEPVVATRRPGAQGLWAAVDLPEGRSDLVISRGASSDEVGVDAGEERRRTVSADDGPECAAAALGSLVAERPRPLTACPSDALSTADETALRELVRFLRTQQVTAITLIEDRSPRGSAAAKAVREEADRAGIAVSAEPAVRSALVVTSGWRQAHAATVRAAKDQRATPTYTRGIYLAPWLLSEPIATSVASASVPLRFDPRERAAVDFTVRFGTVFGGQRPTVGAYHEYLHATGVADRSALRVFSVAQVSVMPMDSRQPHGPGMDAVGDGPGHWITRGTVVPVSLPLGQTSG